MDRLKVYWGTLSSRDRRALVVMIVAVSIWLIVSGLSTLLKANANSERQIQQLRSQLSQMQQLVPVIKGRAEGNQVSGNLAALVNQIGRETEVEYDSLRPNANGLQLAISNTSEEDFAKWLTKLKAHSLNVSAMSLTVDQAGQLAISMQLSTQ
ncbi:type II secretion system protein GspM [Umboniibacter marinipuniceus]|uniref:Type II secretory pathway component PulM n=1 Tax=Umboniibacter marinipuniceus TaxID=569599 RepID=A0A3M0A831_9GAMM|nr:type II secretion system protein GspM [Umboniibacter marinipuniceus]RMA81321.1 type II secretory pathway component PulM [Umboniibacter marinipuniceus]